MHALLQFGVIPIINENDTVAVDEIKLVTTTTFQHWLPALLMQNC